MGAEGGQCLYNREYPTGLVLRSEARRQPNSCSKLHAFVSKRGRGFTGIASFDRRKRPIEPTKQERATLMYSFSSKTASDQIAED